MSAPGGQAPNMTPQQQQQALYQQQQMLRQQQQQQLMQQRQQQMMQQNSPAAGFPQRSRTPQQGGSPALQMHPHLQPHQQPRSPMVPGGPGSVPQPATPQMIQQQMAMNQPMSLPPASHVSRPASVAPPASVPPNMHVTGPPSNQIDQYHPSRPASQQSHLGQGPQSVQPASIQRPGSVLAPGSHGPTAQSGPQSVQAYGPGSVQQPGSQAAQTGPQSVQAYGPGSVQQGPQSQAAQGPGSVQAYGPGSVQQPGSQAAQTGPQSVQAFGPGSVQPPGSAQAPGSVQPPASQQPPASIQPPASGQSTAATKVEPLKPNEEQIRMVQDPVDLVRNLVQKDLRSAIVEMNKRGSELIRQREDGDIRDYDRAQYKRATNDFHAVCDEIDRTLTTVMETAKQLSKLDKVFQDRNAKDLDGDVMVSCVQNFVDNTDTVQKMFDGTIGSVTNTMEKIRRRQKKWEEQQKAKKAQEEDVEMAEA